jgi:3-oxoacyl-[acyl-carrier protein] reductase
MKKFANKVAIITGASTGLGKQIALNLAHDGAQVVIHYHHSAQKAQEVVAEIVESGGQAFTVQADLSAANLDDIASNLISEVISKTKKIDFLINNAADQSLDPEDPLDDDKINSIMRVNVFAPQALVKASLDHLNPGGAIVNITSIEAEFPFPNHSLYAASKAAMYRYTQLAAIELAQQDIRCNAVAPGLINRDDLEKTWPQGLNDWTNKSPQKRPVTANEVANTVSFLLSDEASGITGISITVDGGWSVA